MIFKGVRDGRPYPDPGMTLREWAALPPTQVQLDRLITTKRTLDLDVLLAEDSTFYGDMFATSSSGAASSTSRTACTGRCGRRWPSGQPCTRGFSRSTDAGSTG